MAVFSLILFSVGTIGCMQ